VIVGCVGILASYIDQENGTDNLVFFFITQFGIAMAYQGNFLTINIFPSIFFSTSFGICNTFAIISEIIVLEVITK